MQLPKFFKKQTLEINPIPETIAECLGLEISEFDAITNEISLTLKDNRVDSFKKYLESESYKKHNLDLSNPNDCFILGYAFCAAIMIETQKENFIHLRQHLDELHQQIPSGLTYPLGPSTKGKKIVN